MLSAKTRTQSGMREAPGTAQQHLRPVRRATSTLSYAALPVVPAAAASAWPALSSTTSPAGCAAATPAPVAGLLPPSAASLLGLSAGAFGEPFAASAAALSVAGRGREANSVLSQDSAKSCAPRRSKSASRCESTSAAAGSSFGPWEEQPASVRGRVIFKDFQV